MAIFRLQAETLVQAGLRGLSGVSRLSLAASLPHRPQLRHMSTVVDHPRVPIRAPTAPSLPAGAPAELFTADSQFDTKRQENARRILREAVDAKAPRHNWTREEIVAIYYQPLMELSYQAVCRLLPPVPLMRIHGTNYGKSGIHSSTLPQSGRSPALHPHEH